MNDAGARLLTIAVLHQRAEERHGTYCDACCEAWPCRTWLIAVPENDEQEVTDVDK